jgi:shikimate 5-dehydrogenase
MANQQMKQEKLPPSSMTLEQLLDRGILRRPALVANNPLGPFGNQKILGTLFEHDYPARTPTIEAAALEPLNQASGTSPVLSVALLADPANLPMIMATFRVDPRLLGGGLGVGLKDEAVRQMRKRGWEDPGTLDRLDTFADIAGAVNFWRKEGEQIVGLNTDGPGFAASLAERYDELGRDYPGTNAVVLGGGGTAGAIVPALARDGWDITVLNRTVAKAERIAAATNAAFGQGKVRAAGNSTQEIVEAVSGTDVVINATHIGGTGRFQDYNPLGPTDSRDHNRQVSREILAKAGDKGILIADVVLVQGDTVLIAAAKELGLPTLGPEGMVTYQGAMRLYDTFRSEYDALGISEKEILAMMRQTLEP